MKSAKNIIYILLIIPCVIYQIWDIYNYVRSYNGKIKEVENDTVRRDKQNISADFFENIEFFRRIPYSMRKNHTEYPYVIDHASFFANKKIRYNTETKEYVHTPADKEMTVHVKQIVYSKDSLKCVAFICLEQHDDNIPYLDKREPDMRFDGHVMMGIRDSIVDKFKMYPFSNYRTFGSSNCRNALRSLKKLFFYQIKGREIYKYNRIFKKGTKYTHNLDEPEFFDTAPDFQKNSTTKKYKDYYNLQLYMDGAEIHHYSYYSNQPDSIKQQWDEEIEKWRNAEQ